MQNDTACREQLEALQNKRLTILVKIHIRLRNIILSADPCSSLQTELVELREHATEAQSVKFQADSKMRQLESSLAEKAAEVERLNTQIGEVISIMLIVELFICSFRLQNV